MDDLNVYVSLTGFFFSLLILWSGVGAGVLVIPTLITLFHIDPLVAVASGSAFAFMSKILMTLGHAKYGGIDWRVAIRFLGICLPITVGTSATTAVMSQTHQGALFELTIVIAIILAGLLALTALLSTRSKAIISTWPMFSLSGVTGLLMGLTGVGGGVMVVPALATTGGLPIKIAVATSIPIGLILSLSVCLSHLRLKRSSRLPTDSLVDARCRDCDSTGHTHVSLFRRSAHQTDHLRPHRPRLN